MWIYKKMKCNKCGKETKDDYIIHCYFCEDAFCPDCISQEAMEYIMYECLDCEEMINEEIK